LCRGLVSFRSGVDRVWTQIVDQRFSLDVEVYAGVQMLSLTYFMS
jgi:hypothetical protein